LGSFEEKMRIGFVTEPDATVDLNVLARVVERGLTGHEQRAFDDYLDAFSETIAGGTAEIQRNIIAERVLGLPKGPR
jgi:alkylation response protein AidB-like acyl-CoA dehydrogenase